MIRCKDCTLRRKQLFRAMNGREVGAIARMRKGDLIVPAGTDVIREGARGQAFYTLYEGWAVRYHRLGDEKRQILDVILPGDQVGFTRVLLGESAHSVQTLTPATFCALDGRALPGALKANPAMALELLRTWLTEARRSDLRLTMLGRLSAPERVGYFLIETYDRLRRRGMARGGTTAFPLRGVDVADAVGLSRVHVMRALKELRSEALLDLDGGDLVIPDFAKLARFTGYVPIPRSGKRAVI
jgi:CRP-like cAMP-binding protein